LHIDGKKLSYFKTLCHNRATGFTKAIFKGFSAASDYTKYYQFLFAKRDAMRHERETTRDEGKSESGTVRATFYHATRRERHVYNTQRAHDELRPSDPQFGKPAGGTKFWMNGGAATKAGAVEYSQSNANIQWSYTRIGAPVEVITLEYEQASYLAMRKIIPSDHPSIRRRIDRGEGDESGANSNNLKNETAEEEKYPNNDILDLTFDGAALARRARKRACSMQDFHLSCDLTNDDDELDAPVWTAVKIKKAPRIEGGVVE